MNEIVKVDNDTMTVSARDLHKQVGSTERFSAWFDRQLQFGFVEGEDFTSVKSFTVVNNGAQRELQDYSLSVDMAKQICMVQKNENAKKIRQYLIELERAWNTPEQIMARALKLADKTIANLTATIEEQKPKVEFFDAVTDSRDAIPMADVAKVLDMGMGRNKLFRFLRKNKILTADNKPYQRYVDAGYFRVVEQRYDKGYGEAGINIKTLVFQKGVDFIRKKLEEDDSSA